jgi:hypothetical protein
MDHHLEIPRKRSEKLGINEDIAKNVIKPENEQFLNKSRGYSLSLC